MAGESFSQTAEVGGKVNQSIQDIASSSMQTDEYSSDIVNIINDFTAKGLNGLQSITSSINQQLAIVQQIVASVDQVDKMAKDLQTLSAQG